MTFTGHIIGKEFSVANKTLLSIIIQVCGVLDWIRVIPVLNMCADRFTPVVLYACKQPLC